MRVRAAVGHAQAALGQLGRQPLGVDQGLGLEVAELLGRGQAQGDGETGHGVDMRPALFTGEDRAVKLAGQVAPVGDEHGATRSVQCFVRREANDIGDADRVGVYTGGD